MSSPSKYSALIFDIGDVLFTWSAETKTSISPKTLRKILKSPIWDDFERNRISQETCYKQAGEKFGLAPEEIATAFQQATDSLRSDDRLISVIRELKAASQGQLRVFAMSNISLPHYEVLRTKPADWGIFDELFASGAVGERKPDFKFYGHVISQTGVDPQKAIFVDDKVENVLTARSLGFTGIVFDDVSNVIRKLLNLLGDPIKRGRDFLSSNAKKLESVTDTGVVVEENLAQLLILESTENKDLVNLPEPYPRLWNFFRGESVLVEAPFPDDLNTTSVGLTTTQPDEELVSSIMDEMKGYINDDGIIQSYFAHDRPRFDPGTCINVLTLFYSHGRGKELSKTLEWVHEVILHRAYIDGTRHYGADNTLFLLTRLLASSDSLDLHKFWPLLKERVQERVGEPGDALALAMRILTCHFVDVQDSVDLRHLIRLQCEDGGWEPGSVYHYASGVKIQNRGLTTALAIQAIKESRSVVHFY